MKNVIRILVVLAVIVGGFLIFMANKAGMDARAAYDILDANIEADAGTFTVTEVHEKLGREPDSVTDSDGSTMIEHYDWSSPIRTTTLKVHYEKGAQPFMSKIELD